MFVPLPEVNFDRYDILIAGSGLAAVSVARRAQSRGKRVLMIEAGRADYDATVQAALADIRGRGHYDGQHWPLHWARALGGTSLLWQGWVAPLLERNLAGWPISRAELEPYLEMAATDLGRPPEILTWAAPFLDGFEHRPISLGTPLNLTFDTPEIYAQVDGIDTVLEGAVARLNPREDRRGLTSLSVATLEGAARDVPLRTGQSVVLAAGGMGNAQILLSSEDGTGAAVGNEHDQVGRYLMEHPHLYNCGRVVLPPELRVPAAPESFGEHAVALSPDDTLHAALGGLDLSIELLPARPDDEDLTEGYVLSRIGEGAQVFDLTVRSEMAPDPANRVTVTDGRDPVGLRRLRTSCIVGGDAFRAVDHALEALGRAIAAAGPGRLRIVNGAIYRGLAGGGHTMGTTRMGTDPVTSVVDADCRVHGYENLFVAGSSVFATGGYANPTLNLMALAHRLGDHLGGAA